MSEQDVSVELSACTRACCVSDVPRDQTAAAVKRALTDTRLQLQVGRND